MTGKKWFLEFRNGRLSRSDAKLSGGLIEFDTPHKIGKIHDMVLAARVFKVRENVETIDISHCRTGAASTYT